MNRESTFGTALLRGFYLAVGSFLVVALPVWATTDEWKPIVIAGGMAALASLGFRGVAEGMYDANRAKNLDQKPSDVGYKPPQPGV
jgi:hypothetical protein